MKPELRIFNESEKLSRHAANLFIESSHLAILERGRFLVALNGGTAPVRLFHFLATEYKVDVDWNRVHIFWGDERCVPLNDPGSNYGQARELLLSHIQIPDENIHRVKTELGPGEASRDYSLTLSHFASPPFNVPRFDLILLGLGEDGHTASLFPGSALYVTEVVIPVTAEYQDRPADRVTMTQLIFNEARHVVFMATGEKKANALAEVLSGKYKPEQYPAQRVDPKDGELIWLVDEAAAARLSRKIRGLNVCEG